MPSAVEPGDERSLFVWSLFHFSIIISPPFYVIGSIAAILRCHLPRTAARKNQEEHVILPAWTFSRICGPTLTRQPSIASIVRPRMAPSPDMWTVLFRWFWGQIAIGEDGPEAETGTCNRQRRRVNIHTSTPSMWVTFGRRMSRAIGTRTLSRESRNAGTGLAGGSGVLPGGLVKTKWPNPRKWMHLLACCAKAAHQTFAGIEMIAFRGHVIAACQRLPKTDSASLTRLSWSASSTPTATVPSLLPLQIDYATDPSHQPWPCAQGARGQPKRASRRARRLGRTRLLHS